MSAQELAKQLSTRAEEVCRELLPGGRRSGTEYECADTSGGKGKSLKVHVGSKRPGAWSDFATGESGDLLDLWCAVRGVELGEAMKQARSFLGVPDLAFKPAKKDYKRPERPKVKAVDANQTIFNYLINERKIPQETLSAYKIAADNRDCVVYPYMRDGELINYKYLGIYRDADGNRKMWTAKEAEPCLFGWQIVPAKARAVAITEGEIDAMTLHQFGIPAMSVPFGGGAKGKQQWIEYEYPNLERFDTIYLCLDQDGPGLEATKDLIQRLGQHRCRVVTFGEHKDANDAIKAGWGGDEFIAAIKGSRTLDPEELKNAADFDTNAIMETFYPPHDEPPGLKTPWPKVGTDLLFRPCEVTIWNGINGHGKSMILSQLIVDAVRQGERACVASMEMPPKAQMHRMIRQVTAFETPTPELIRRAQVWLGGNENDSNSGGLWLFSVVGTAKADRLLDVMTYARQRYNVRQFVIDSLAKCGIAEDDYNGQKSFVERLVDFSHMYESHVHLVTHSRKGKDEMGAPDKMDVKGTGAITDMVDNLVTVWRNKRKEHEIAEAEDTGSAMDADTLGKPDAIAVVQKQRATGWERPINLWFHPESLQFVGNYGDSPFQYIGFAGPHQEVPQ